MTVLWCTLKGGSNLPHLPTLPPPMTAKKRVSD